MEAREMALNEAKLGDPMRGLVLALVYVGDAIAATELLSGEAARALGMIGTELGSISIAIGERP